MQNFWDRSVQQFDRDAHAALYKHPYIHTSLHTYILHTYIQILQLYIYIDCWKILWNAGCYNEDSWCHKSFCLVSNFNCLDWLSLSASLVCWWISSWFLLKTFTEVEFLTFVMYCLLLYLYLHFNVYVNKYYIL